jgi:hypothetical protein
MVSAARLFPAKAWIVPPRRKIKVFWFFSSEKNILAWEASDGFFEAEFLRHGRGLGAAGG